MTHSFSAPNGAHWEITRATFPTLAVALRAHGEQVGDYALLSPHHALELAEALTDAARRTLEVAAHA